MSIEYALEKFPITVRVNNELACEVRPLRPGDEERIKRLYLAVPKHERLFIKEKLTDGHVFHEWCKAIDVDSNLTLLLNHDGGVLAEGTLHQRQGGWKSHIGLVSELTHPDHRGIGLSGILLEELVEIGRHAGLQRLEAEFTGDRTTAIREFAKAGFEELVRLPNYVKDVDRNFYDYVVMGMKLKTPEEFAGVG